MFTSASILGGLICRRLPPAGGGHPKPARYVGHVPEPDQPSAVFGGDYRWRFEYGRPVSDLKQGRQLFGRERF